MRMIIDGGVGMKHTFISRHADDFDTGLDHIRARAGQVNGLRDASPHKPSAWPSDPTPTPFPVG